MEQETKLVNLVIENDSDLFNRKIWILNFLLIKGSLEQAEESVRQAVKEYLKTPEGKRDVVYAGGQYNWGDVASTIPDSFWEEHGLKPVHNTAAGIWVNHDEVLV